MFPTIEAIEDYLESLEGVVFASLSAATPDLPAVRETFNRLWDDVSRFGPVLSDIHVPSLGDFQIPAPPPPPPPPKSFWEKSADWCSDHPWKIVGIGVGVVGVGLWVGYYGSRRTSRGPGHRKAKGAAALNERRQIIVVLGGDRPLGLPLIADLEKKGYIIVTSVATSEAVDALEQKSHGYVKALVLDPTDPTTVSIFLRSLSSTLSRRFPINASGDPHTPLSSQPYIHSIISLLTLSSPSPTLPPMPLEHLSLDSTYLSYLQSTHITPLQVIQALLPLLRTSTARAKDALNYNKGKQSIVVCLPATDTLVGMPFASAQAMSAAATLRGIQVLRREIKISALSAASSDMMKNLRVVTVDVGVFEDRDYTQDVGVSVVDAQNAMEDWTPSEKNAYGPALLSISDQDSSLSRRPTDPSAFVNDVVDIVGGDRTGRSGRRAVVGLGILYRLRNWIRGDRISVGAGARTYFWASALPTFMLDALLSLPHVLISFRNALLPIAPSRSDPPTQLSFTTVAVRPRPAVHTTTQQQDTTHSGSSVTSDQDERADPETGSEADVESNAGDGSGVGGSWVSLKEGLVSGSELSVTTT